MPYDGMVWKNLRHLFYIFFFLSGAISIYLLVLNGLWLLVAALIEPVKVVPYAVSMLGLLIPPALRACVFSCICMYVCMYIIIYAHHNTYILIHVQRYLHIIIYVDIMCTY